MSIKGIFPCDAQIIEYAQAAFRGYENYYLKIIKRAQKARIRFSGDLAPIVLLGGNHFINTTDREVNEGLILALLLSFKLESRIKGNPEDLIKSPRFGTEPIGRGTIKFFRGAEFAIVLRHKEIAGAAKYDHPMRRIVEANKKRGAYDPIEQGRPSQHWSGHTHMGGHAQTKNVSFNVSGSQTYHDPYGDRLGFPLNYIASTVKGLPVKGPAWGPEVLIHLEHSFFQKARQYWKEWDIDRKVLFELA